MQRAPHRIGKSLQTIPKNKEGRDAKCSASHRKKPTNDPQKQRKGGDAKCPASHRKKRPNDPQSQGSARMQRASQRMGKSLRTQKHPRRPEWRGSNPRAPHWLDTDYVRDCKSRSASSAGIAVLSITIHPSAADFRNISFVNRIVSSRIAGSKSLFVRSRFRRKFASKSGSKSTLRTGRSAR